MPKGLLLVLGLLLLGSLIFYERDNLKNFSRGALQQKGYHHLASNENQNNSRMTQSVLGASVFTISGTVFMDNNKNGIQDPGEQGYKDATLTAVSASSSATTTTKPDGSYQFQNLPADTYTVTLTLPPSATNTTPISQTVMLSANTTVNFGINVTYGISAHVFIDNNANGVNDAGDGNFANLPVTLTNGTTSTTQNTDANGNATFPNSQLGVYVLSLNVPQGYGNTTPTSQTVNLLNADQSEEFGLVPIPPLSGCAQSTPSDIMLLFDVSNSMNDKDPSNSNDSKINEAKIAANQFLRIIAQDHPNSRVGLTTFASSTPGDYKLVSPFTSDFTTLENQINSLSTNSRVGTCHECGLEISNNEFKADARTGVKHIAVFLTDGEANQTIASKGNYTNPWSASEPPAMNQVQYGNSNYDIIFDSIGLGTPGQDYNESFMQQIADSTGGTYYNDPKQGDLTTIFSEIADGNVGTAVIKGFAFNDNNMNKTFDSGEQTLSGWTIQLQNGSNTVTATTDSYGNYAFSGLCTGTYLLQETMQPGWFSTLPSNPSYYVVNITDGNTYNDNFGNKQGYEISGTVFDDINKDRLEDDGETGYSGGVTITTTGGTLTTNPDGSFDIKGILTPGTYFVSYTSPLPKGFLMIYPKNGPPPTFAVTVGPNCNVDGATGATCDPYGNVTNLNFAISDSIPWIQAYGSDVRIDAGYQDWIPKNPTCPAYFLNQDTNATTPGVFFTGDTDSSFGQGQVSPTDWIAGGAFSPEVYTPATSYPLATSYEKLSEKATQAGIQPTDLTSFSTCLDLANCNLPPNLPNGVYIANGDVTLGGYTFTGNKNYVFLINGTVTLDGAIQVQPGSTAVFAAAKDIVVDRSVGATTNVCPIPSGQVQGIFSADNNFIVDGVNDCTVQPDEMLNIEGTVITNASGTGGSFINNRDLCADDQHVPSVTMKERLDFLLNMPTFLMQQSSSSQEVTP